MATNITLGEVETMAGHAARSGCYGKAERDESADAAHARIVGECVLRILRGVELGMSPTQALDAWHNMKGKLVLKSDLHVGVCLKRTDLCEHFALVTDPSSREVQTYRVQRVGGEAREFSFSMADAKNAGLLSNATWQKYPAAMLRARCGAIAARAMFPDLLGGLYDEGEGAEIAAARGGRGRYSGGTGQPEPRQLGPAPTAGASTVGAGADEEVAPGELVPSAADATARALACVTRGALDDLVVEARKAAVYWTGPQRAAFKATLVARERQLADDELAAGVALSAPAVAPATVSPEAPPADAA